MKMRSVSDDGSFMVAIINGIIDFLGWFGVEDVNKVPVRTTAEMIRRYKEGRTRGMDRVVQPGERSRY